MVAVVIDSSVIRGASWKSARLLSLFALAKDGSLELFIPETALHEVRTHWREDYDKNLRNLSRSLKLMRLAPLLPGPEKTVLDALEVEIKKATSSEDLSRTTFDSLCTDNNIAVRPSTPEQMARAWESYFKGEPPFGSVKDRNDLPDAHIFETIKDLAVEKPGLFIVCADGRLTKACASLPGSTVFNSLDDLLDNPSVKKAEHATKLSKHWDSVKADLFERIDEEILDFIHANVEEILVGSTVHDKAIPSDGNDANITMYGDAQHIEIVDRDEYAKGFLSYSVTFTSECLLDFFVHKWDAYEVPSWVSVSYGDPEEDHYFEAEGEREVVVNLILTLEVDLRENFDDDEPILRDIQVSGKPEFHLA